jgi:hypothetical protein
MFFHVTFPVQWVLKALKLDDIPWAFLWHDKECEGERPNLKKPIERLFESDEAVDLNGDFEMSANSTCLVDWDTAKSKGNPRFTGIYPKKFEDERLDDVFAKEGRLLFYLR